MTELKSDLAQPASSEDAGDHATGSSSAVLEVAEPRELRAPSNPEDNQIGYKKPPKRSQFQRGVSGNPRGRSKGSKNLATVLEERLGEEVTVTERGRRRTISKLEAAVRQLVSRATADDPRALHQLFRLAQWMDGRADTSRPPAQALSDDDREVIFAVHARLKERDGGASHE